MKLSPGRLLDIAAAVGFDGGRGAQLWEATALLEAARPAGLPDPSAAPGVRAYAETQGLGAYTPPAAPFPLAPAAPALLWWDDAAPEAPARLAALLLQRYAATLEVRLLALDAAGDPLAPPAALPLAAVAAHRAPAAARLTLLLLPPLAPAADRRSPEALAWVMARLLGPGGCPWDVWQTHQSLRGALLEETYEVLEALDTGDMAALGEELGDVLIAIYGHSEMARQAGHFDLGDVFAQITTKLIGRHPHVFGDLAVDGEGQVLQNWEQIKAAELAAKGKARASALDGVPPALPALAAAQELGKKAARAGFNWAEQAQVWAKLHEELAELAAAASPAHAAEELGDALFVLTRLADWLHLDAEMALRDANRKFRARFTLVEAAAAARGRPLTAMALDELLALWAEAKAQGAAGG